MAEQYIYVMKGLRKLYPPHREVLKDIWLSFLPGAKIGVLGLNGAGKSTLLKIMAGQITEFDGEAWPAKGIKVGYLPQEPQLDPDKDVRGNVEDGVAETRALLDRFDEISARFGEEMSDQEMEKLLAEQAEVQDLIDAKGPGRSIAPSRSPWMRCACRPAMPTVDPVSQGVSGAASPFAGCCCRLPDLLLLDEPTNHLDAESVAWLERFLAEYPGHRGGGDP